MKLERQLQELLEVVMNYEVPIDGTDVSHIAHKPEKSKRSRRTGRAGSTDGSPRTSEFESDQDDESQRKARGVRLLCDLFVTAPIDAIDDYSQLVRHVMDLDTIREKLRLHRYQTVRPFTGSMHKRLHPQRLLSV